MSDEQNDEIDDTLEENAVPVDNQIRTDVPQAPVDDIAVGFEEATVQASKAHEEEHDAEETDNFSFDFDPTPNEHVTVANPLFKRQKLNPNHPALASLKLTRDEVEAIIVKKGLNNLDDDQLDKLSTEDRRLLNLYDSLSAMYQDVYFDDIDKAGDWHQAIATEGTRLGLGRFKIENMSDPVMAIRATFGQGTVIQVPLWNTGIWISIKAPTLQELIDFEQRTRLEKMNLGRSTNGMVFSNVEVYSTEIYMSFALEHVISASYQFETTDTVAELLKVIKNRDYQQIMLGLVSAMYPDGYPFRQPCVANTDKCTHIDDLLLNFARMGFVDREKLTDKQVRMMTSRKAKRTREQLAEYQSEFAFFEKRIDLGNGLTAVLGVPSLAQQIDAGHAWVDGITRATTEAFGARLAETERIRHIMRSGAMTGLRMHSHWIDRFEHQADPDQEPRIIEDMVNKDRTLELLSEDIELSAKFNKDIMDWVKGTTVSYVGIPKTACPGCQKEPEDQSHPYLIPLDIGYVFFTLAALKISLVEDAAM